MLVWNPYVSPLLVASLVLWALASAVYLARPGRAENRLASAILFLEGAVGLSIVARLSSTTLPEVYAWFIVDIILQMTIYGVPVLYFMLLARLDTPLARPLRSRTAIAVLWVTAGLAMLSVPVRPTLWYSGFAPTSFAAFEFQGGVLWTILTVTTPLFFSYALLVSVSAWRRAPRRTPARSKAGAFALAFGARDSLFVVYYIAFFFAGVDMLWSLFAAPLILFLFAGLFTYGILKQQVLDIDLKIKWTLNRATLVAFFVAFFFVVSELTAVLFAERVGPVLGILAAGLLLFAIAPLQRLADRVADTAMPGVADTDEYRTVRKRAVYQAALESALLDGTLSDKERDVLATLADQLGLSAGDARAMERDVTGPAEVA